VLAEGALPALLAQLAAAGGNSVGFTTTATHALKSLCQHVPQAAYEVMEPALPLLAGLIQAEGQDAAVLANCASALSSMTLGDAETVDAVLRTGVLPRLVQLLMHTALPVRRAAAATVSNVAAGSAAHKRAVVAEGAVPLLVRLVTGDAGEGRAAAARALANLASENPGPRDAVMAAGALPAVLAQLAARDRAEDAEEEGFTLQAARLLQNLCCGAPKLPYPTLAPALPVLSELMLTPAVADSVLAHATWAVGGVAHVSAAGAAAVAGTAGLARRAVQLLAHAESSVCSAASLVVAGLSADDSGWRQLVAAGALPALGAAQVHPTTRVRIRACLALGDVVSRGPGRIQDVLDARLLPLLVRLLGDAEPAVRAESAGVAANLAEAGSPAQVRALVAAGAIPPLVRLLEAVDGGSSGVTHALTALRHILAAGVTRAAERGEGAEGRAANAYAEAARAAGAQAALAALARIAAAEEGNIFAGASASSLLHGYFE
jgi:importin subunit alpha-1